MLEQRPGDTGTASPSWSPAARRILRVAAELFARQGYFATTTRDIAAAVGVKQPAIYKHFATKDAILAALVQLGLDYPFRLAAHLQSVPAPAAVRLYAWIARALRHFQESPYVLASMLVTPELQREQFAAEQALFNRLEQLVADLVSEGQRDGELRLMDPVAGARLVLALFDALAVPETAVAPAEIAEFAIRALLADPNRSVQLQRGAAEIGDVEG